MNNYKRIFIILLLCINAFCLHSQVSIEAVLDSSSIKMGQQTKLHLKISQPQSVSLRMPSFNDMLVDELYIVDITGDTVVEGNSISVNQHLVLTAFQPGEYTIPSIKCVDSENKEYATNEIKLTVNDVPIQFEDGHIPEDIKNIYDPTFSKFIKLLLTLLPLLIVGILVFTYFYWKKHKDDPEPFVYNDAVANSSQPELTAMELIRKMGEEKMWQTPGNEKKFFTLLTDVLRQYFYRRYNINAMEMTSTELIEALRKQDVSYVVREKVKHICFTGDMTKFAKHKPTDDECMGCVNIAEELIKLTSPVTESQSGNANEEPKNENK